MTRKELADALLADKGLLPYIVHQGLYLTGTRPFWRNKSNSFRPRPDSSRLVYPLFL